MNGVIFYSLATGDTGPMVLGGLVLFIMLAGACLYLAVDSVIKYLKRKLRK